MDYHVALSRGLGLSLQDFADAWNEAPECRSVAQARVSQVQNTQFGMTLYEVILTVALGATGSAVYDLIKTGIEAALRRRGVQEPIKTINQERSDGSHVLAVTAVEEQSP